MRNNGKSLERLVRIVEEVYKTNPETKIYSNYKIENNSQNKREIDLLIKSVINNFNITIAIECKEFSKKISVEKIEAFNSKCLRIPEINKKIFISEKGFQKDAIASAKDFGIELYTLDFVERNAKSLLLPIIQIKPSFKGFEILSIYCEDHPLLSEIRIKEVSEYLSMNGKDKFSLYELIELGAKPNWHQISGVAFYHWMKDKVINHQIHFFINCSGIYFIYKNENIFVNQIECNTYIEFEFIETKIDEKAYKNFMNGETKANILSFELEKAIKGSIVVDSKENIHFFDTTDKIKKLNILYKYDPKTDSFEYYK